MICTGSVDCLTWHVQHPNIKTFAHMGLTLLTQGLIVMPIILIVPLFDMQLGQFLAPLVDNVRGMMAMADVYCLFN